jgi:hypothetical protein
MDARALVISHGDDMLLATMRACAYGGDPAPLLASLVRAVYAPRKSKRRWTVAEDGLVRTSHARSLGLNRARE